MNLVSVFVVHVCLVLKQVFLRELFLLSCDICSPSTASNSSRVRLCFICRDVSKYAVGAKLVEIGLVCIIG